MKKKTYITTEFYKKPSEALSFVKDGGIVYLGYKKMKEPFAVLTSIKDYTKVTESTKLNKKGLTLSERIGKYPSIFAPEYKDSAKYIREQREKEWKKLS
jgi:hypothetical protein